VKEWRWLPSPERKTLRFAIHVAAAQHFRLLLPKFYLRSSRSITRILFKTTFGEDPEQAALREAKEESGLDVELLGERPPTTSPGTRALIAPRFLDIHRINETHEHIGMIYWARPKNSAAIKLATGEHHDIRWCSLEDLEKLSPPMTDAVKWYCRQAIEEISRR
jgi:ADP-ribose pyrophosphatase YjhB (NUDIX family)